MSTSSDVIRKVDYVLFDLDGLMLDSERVYTDVTNAILSRFGKEMSMEIKAGCMGKRTSYIPHPRILSNQIASGTAEKPATEYLLSFFPGIPITVDEYIKERRELQDRSWPNVRPLPGIVKLVQHLAKHSIPIAVATGSMRRNYDLKTAHLEEEVFKYFGDKVVCGDDPRLEGRGKPAPDVFLIAAGVLGRDIGKGDVDAIEGPAEQVERYKAERARGLVFEDAHSGMEAAKRAGMNVVWVPDPIILKITGQMGLEADQMLDSLEYFRPEQWGLPPYDS
ncbi:hypothetical protein FRB99_006363 [Tulasnella sp. 403]|nr:hypothetical protein FRB99_006363 [Tulasnella sp. 403]